MLIGRLGSLADRNGNHGTLSGGSGQESQHEVALSFRIVPDPSIVPRFHRFREHIYSLSFSFLFFFFFLCFFFQKRDESNEPSSTVRAACTSRDRGPRSDPFEQFENRVRNNDRRSSTFDDFLKRLKVEGGSTIRDPRSRALHVVLERGRSETVPK